MAHEFAHIFQFKNCITRNPPGPWQMEPHADYLAGWFLSTTSTAWIVGTGDKAFVVDAPREWSDLDIAIKSIFAKGDSEFTNPQHHGQEEFRAAMVRAGYYDGALKLQDAAIKGMHITDLETPTGAYWNWRLGTCKESGH
jgi:hypothetical protein